METDSPSRIGAGPAASADDSAIGLMAGDCFGPTFAATGRVAIVRRLWGAVPRCIESVPTLDKTRNAYAVLGLHKGASEDQVKLAYVGLVKKFPPEVHTERFMIVQRAFDSLKDPEKRARQDILTFNHMPGEFQFSKDERVDVPEACG